MDPVYLTEEHNILRDTARRYIEEDVRPHGDALGGGRGNPARCVRPDGRSRFLRGAGAGGLWRHRYGADRHGCPMGGAGQIQLRRLHRQHLGPCRNGGAAPDQRRQRGAERAPAARPDRRPQGQQHRGDRTGRRLRRRRAQDPGQAPGQRPLGAERQQGVHHQRLPGRRLFRRRAHRSAGQGLARHFHVHRREGRAGLQGRQEARQARAGAVRTPPNWSSRIAKSPTTIFSARRTRASTP